MPVEAVAERKESLYYEQLPQLKAIPEVLEHIEASTAEFPSPWSPAAGAIRSWARLTALGPARQVRHHRRRGRLQERQTRPGRLSAGRGRLGVAPRRLPGL